MLTGTLKFHTLCSDGTESIFAYSCTKFSKEEIDGEGKRRDEELQRMFMIRKQSKHTDRGHRGVMAENFIAYAR